MSRFTMAAAAATLALFGLAMSAHATSLNDAPGGMVFQGSQVTRSDGRSAQTSITAMGSVIAPYVDIHIVDPNNPVSKNAIDCVVDQIGEYVPQFYYQIGGPAGDTDGGIFTLHPDYCYFTAAGKASSFTPYNASFTWQWHISDVQGDWFIQAANMSLAIPSLCTYNGFSGTGQVTKQP